MATMNFFERQRQVRRLSIQLVLLFAVAVIGIVITVDLAAVLVFNGLSREPAELAGMVLVVSLLTMSAIGLAALVRTVALRGGGGRVARELGGVLVPQDTTDPQLRRLRNVVEEIAIASGTPVPEVYVLPNEPGINAFAAGWSPSDAAIAVTQGALDRLNRAELQGVIAHEFSHVVNGDMRLNIRLMGLLYGILFLAVIGRTLAHFGAFTGGGRSRGGRSGGNAGAGVALIGLALVAAGFIGVLVGRLIQAAVSRQREYLADASAVQFTRQPSGLAGALKKIAGLQAGSRMTSPKSEEVGHMLFGPSRAFSSLFSTHPPILERIKILEPSFDPRELEQLARDWAASPPSGLAEDVALGLVEAAPAAPAATPLPTPGTPAPVDARNVIQRIATPPQEAFAKAEALIHEIPDDVLNRARSRQAVVALVLGLLHSDDPEVRRVQHGVLAARYGTQLADAAWHEANELANLHPLLRLPLAQLALPALRQRSVAEQNVVLDQIFALIRADGRISVYEYCLSRLVYAELQESLHPAAQWLPDRHHLADCYGAVTTLLAVLAHAGTPDADAARRAFLAGMGLAFPGHEPRYAPPADGVLALEQVWPQLVHLVPEDKERLVQAAVAVISHDKVTTVAELELLRTVCALLHCPFPL